MSNWHDIVSSQPQDAQLVLIRRSPGDCPPLAANWDAGNAQFLCGPERWVIPWQFVLQWRLPGTAPAWPQPRVAASPWQDIYLCPPADGQPLWLRRSGEESAAFRATFDRASRVLTLPNGWEIQWYQASKWRAG
jgi:hypothetical protein